MTTDTEIQRILRKYSTIICQQVGQPEEMDKFLETYSLPRLNQQETKNLKRPVTTKIKSVIKRLPTNKNPGPVASQLNVTKSQRRINTYPSQTIPKSKRREGSETHFTRPVLP